MECHTALVLEWPMFAHLAAQTLPSRYMWEEITWTPSRQALCHRLRSIIGTSEGDLKTTRAIEESLSNHIFVQPWCAANSKAKMIPWTSDEKTVAWPRLQENAPRKVPRWSRKIPPQAAWLLMSQYISVFNILFESVLFRFDFVLFNIISFLELFYFNCKLLYFRNKYLTDWVLEQKKED